MLQLQTPIAFCIFNRPRVTERVFEEIAKQRPRHLLVIADGPRFDHPGDPEQVSRTSQILNRIDWPCDLRTCFAEQNLGCGKRMGTGLTWAFEQFEELIILEDDCLPDQSFFGFCEQLLSRFRDNPQVMMISGNNFLPEPHSPHSYYFSKWPHIWGWASWRQAWQHFQDITPPANDAELASVLQQVFSHSCELERWTSILRDFFDGKIDTWDFLWTYTIWQKQGLTVLPNLNLVSNLGFGPGATHTIDENSPLAEIPTQQILQLDHPLHIEPDQVADRWTFENIMHLNGSTDPLVQNVPSHSKRNWLKRLLRPGYKSSIRA